MRHITQSEAVCQMQETRNSTHRINRFICGHTQQFLDSGFGKTVNQDFDILHTIDT